MHHVGGDAEVHGGTGRLRYPPEKETEMALCVFWLEYDREDWLERPEGGDDQKGTTRETIHSWARELTADA